MIVKVMMRQVFAQKKNEGAVNNITIPHRVSRFQTFFYVHIFFMVMMMMMMMKDSRFS